MSTEIIAYRTSEPTSPLPDQKIDFLPRTGGRGQFVIEPLLLDRSVNLLSLTQLPPLVEEGWIGPCDELTDLRFQKFYYREGSEILAMAVSESDVQEFISDRVGEKEYQITTDAGLVYVNMNTQTGEFIAQPRLKARVLGLSITVERRNINRNRR